MLTGKAGISGRTMMSTLLNGQKGSRIKISVKTVQKKIVSFAMRSTMENPEFKKAADEMIKGVTPLISPRLMIRYQAELLTKKEIPLWKP